jgi:hypothetical protein
VDFRAWLGWGVVGPLGPWREAAVSHVDQRFFDLFS